MKRKAENQPIRKKSKKTNHGKDHVNTFCKVTFLGTSAAIPTTHRNMSAMCLTMLDGSGILVDCGEATQHQFMRSNLKSNHVGCICITHLHGDHSYGLFGFLHTVSQQVADDEEVIVIGPKGIRELLNTVFSLSGGIPFHNTLKIFELEKQKAHFVCEYKSVKIHAAPLNHRVPTYGYVFEEPQKKQTLDGKKAKALGAKGPQLGQLKAGKDIILKSGVVIKSSDVLGKKIPARKIAVIWDTRNSSLAEPICQNVDLMIHEATYDCSCSEKAFSTGHSTAQMAGNFAKKCGAKLLVLTHFSPRYEKGFSSTIENNLSAIPVDVDDLQIEASKVSGCPVLCAQDFFSLITKRNQNSFIVGPIALKPGLYADYVMEHRKLAEREAKKYKCKIIKQNQTKTTKKIATNAAMATM